MDGVVSQYPLRYPAPPARATLWQLYLAEGGRPHAPLAVALLSDANIAMLTGVMQKKAAIKLGPLAPPLEDLTVEHSDAFANAVMQAALDLGWMGVSQATLLAANKQVVEWALVRLTTEQSTFHRHKEFMEQGVNPAMAPRPTFDTAQMDRKELQHAPLGHGLYSPWDAYAEQRGLFDTFQPFNGLTPQEGTGSDDMRFRVVPWAPPAVHGQIPWRG